MSLRPPKYPTVPETRLTQERWRIKELGLFRLERGTPQLLRQMDTEWLGLLEKPDDFTQGWRFHELGVGREERFVVRSEDELSIAAWLDHDRLVSGDAYRLDFFKVRPDLHRMGLGRFVLGLIGLRALERGARRLVFQSLPEPADFYRKSAPPTASTGKALRACLVSRWESKR